MPTYPYISGQGPLVQTFAQLRKGFPAKVDAGYLQRFNIAPANESYVISILRFLGVISEDGSRVEESTEFFYGNDDSFKSGLNSTLRSSYSQLFDEMGEAALSAERSELAHWFRASDKTSEVVGQRQASTFQTLAALVGHGEVPVARTAAPKKLGATSPRVSKAAAARPTIPKKATAAAARPPAGDVGSKILQDQVTDTAGVGLTVRIEVNLPPGGDVETYDAIFASIKKHLMS